MTKTLTKILKLRLESRLETGWFCSAHQIDTRFVKILFHSGRKSLMNSLE